VKTPVTNAFLVLLSILVALALGELVVRVAAPQSLTTAVAYHPVLGWRNPPNTRTVVVKREYRTTVSINSKGLRNREIDYARRAGVHRVLVLGDSFAWGSGVEDDETFSAVLESLYDGKLEVINAGVSGYGTDQEYLYYTTEGYRYDPDIVVLAFYANDIENNLLPSNRGGPEGKPYFVLVDGILRLHNVPVPDYREGGVAADIERFLRGHSQLFTLLYSYRLYLKLFYNPGKALRFRLKNDASHVLGFASDWEARAFPCMREWPEAGEKGWRLTAELFTALDRQVREHGARLVIMPIPDKCVVHDKDWQRRIAKAGYGPADFDRDRLHRRLLDFGGQKNIEVVPLLEFLRSLSQSRLYFDRDAHLNAIGHRRVAEGLAAFFTENNLLAAPNTPRGSKN
jgi:hypothetical protein